MTELIDSSLPTLVGWPAMNANDFERAIRLIKDRAGIILGNHKEDMVARNLGIATKKMGFYQVSDYLDHLSVTSDSPEWNTFIGIFTINHTAFYREHHHFDILAAFVKKRQKPISVWCSACSTGEEAYSIAMTLQENVPNPEIGVQFLATDIDAAAVKKARQGVYTLDRIQPVPAEMLRKYFQKGTGANGGMARVKPQLQNVVSFDVLNLLSVEGWPVGQSVDAIFCRNTMIYFDKNTQAQLLERFAKVLKPGGLLFVGHSESFTHMTKSLVLQGQTVYVRV